MDSRYQLYLSKSHPGLIDAIQCYISFSNTMRVSKPLKISGNNTCNLVFSFGKFITFHDRISSRSHKLSSAYLIGPLFQYYEIEYSPKTDYFVICFTSEFATLLADVPANILKQQPLAPENLLVDVKLLEEQLYPLSHSERVNLCNNLFLRILQDIPYTRKMEHFQLARYAMRRIEKDNALKVSKLADETGFSPKHLNDILMSMTGYSPKQIIRFYRYIKMLYTIHQYENMSSAAIDAGYYDQSHMCKDFMYFSKQTPWLAKTNGSYLFENMLRESMSLPLLNICELLSKSGQIWPQKMTFY